MGNRAIIKSINSTMGVYLHWNGGIDSVTAFLKYCEMKGYAGFEDCYGIARFCQVVGNYFGGSSSLGLVNNVYETEEYASSLDNGIYVVDGWKIVKRIGNHTSSEGYTLTDMLCDIDDAQPKSERLTKGYITAKEVDASELKIGDKIYYQNNLDGKVSLQTIVGFGAKGKWCNGSDVTGVPYINKYSQDNPENNPNNYIRGKVRVKDISESKEQSTHKRHHYHSHHHKHYKNCKN